MLTRSVIRSVLASVICVVSVGPTIANADGKYVVVRATIDQTQQPISVLGTVNNCVHNPICQGLLDAGADTIFGYDISQITLAASVLTPPESHGDEEHIYGIKLPPGYAYCHSSVDVLSANPASGSRAAKLRVRRFSEVLHEEPNGLTADIWTPQKNATEGRSWMKVVFTIVGAPAGIPDSSCHAATEEFVVNCSGKDCGHWED